MKSSFGSSTNRDAKTVPMDSSETPIDQTASTKIVVVDDEYAIRRTIARVLATDGFECEIFASVAEAIEHLKARPVDLLITDILMPEHDGLELLMFVRKKVQPQPKVITMSGGSRGLDAQYLMRTAGGLGPVSATLVKPFSADELRSAVKKVLSTGD